MRQFLMSEVPLCMVGVSVGIWDLHAFFPCADLRRLREGIDVGRIVPNIQGYLANKKPPSPRTLQ